jgi:prepilin-type N-terminal cleavage/methylation domain-containing protein
MRYVLGTGYTLIEILVGLTIMAVIFSFGFVSFRDFSRRQALVGVARTLKGDLRLAQEYALSGKKPEGCLTLNGFNFSVTSESEYKIQAFCADSAIDVKSVALPEGITFATPLPSLFYFKVLGAGTSLSANLVITLTQSATGNSQVITVTPAGEIR